MPDAIARDQVRWAIALVQEIDRAYAEVMPSVYAELDRNDSGNRLDTDRERIKELLERARKTSTSFVTGEKISGRVVRLVDQIAEFNLIQFNGYVKSLLGINPLLGDPKLRAVARGAVEEHVALIKSIPEQLHGQIESTIWRAVNQGTHVGTLKKEIAQRFAVSESRGALIARDQTMKTYAAINVSRAKAIGVTAFVWRTANDERVRRAHRELDGHTYLYTNPPSEGLPGQPIQCRCYAEPILDHILGED